jgi:hypothetical protein
MGATGVAIGSIRPLSNLVSSRPGRTARSHMALPVEVRIEAATVSFCFLFACTPILWT